MTSIDKIKAAKESEEIMSEDVKPRQWTLVFDHDEEIGHIRTLANYSKENRHEEHVNVIELEPTLQLMEEMGNKLSEVENYLHFRTDDLCGDDIKGDKKHTERFHQLTKSISYSLEKYRKFKEGLK